MPLGPPRGCAESPPLRPADWLYRPARHALLSQWAEAKRRRLAWEPRCLYLATPSVRPWEAARARSSGLLGAAEEAPVFFPLQGGGRGLTATDAWASVVHQQVQVIEAKAELEIRVAGCRAVLTP
nr:uncharacterized protein LOC111751872 isoform X2 [Loxodonta africana]